MNDFTTAAPADDTDVSDLVLNEALINEYWNSESDGGLSKAEADMPEPADEWNEEELKNSAPKAEDKADQSYKLKHLGEEFEVSRDEIIALAQKGKDYDRIRKRADELAETAAKNSGYIRFLDELAKTAGQSVDEFVSKTRTALQPEGTIQNSPQNLGGFNQDSSAASAVNRIASAEAAAEKQMDSDRKSREVREFLTEYSHIEPGSIPREVWDSVASGKSLLSAYQGYENKTLKTRMEAEQKNSVNKARSIGSLFSAGTMRSRGEIEDDWYKNE